jgi:hypothetical protein
VNCLQHSVPTSPPRFGVKFFGFLIQDSILGFTDYDFEITEITEITKIKRKITYLMFDQGGY